MLSDQQIDLIERSWDTVLKNHGEAASIFYRNLFAMDPGLRKMFRSDMHRQSQKLIDTITFLVHKLGEHQHITEDVKALGQWHYQKAITSRHYELGGSALLATLKELLGEEWNEMVQDAWTSVYDHISSIMIGASEEQ